MSYLSALWLLSTVKLRVPSPGVSKGLLVKFRPENIFCVASFLNKAAEAHLTPLTITFPPLKPASPQTSPIQLPLPTISSVQAVSLLPPRCKSVAVAKSACPVCKQFLLLQRGLCKPFLLLQTVSTIIAPIAPSVQIVSPMEQQAVQTFSAIAMIVQTVSSIAPALQTVTTIAPTMCKPFLLLHQAPKPCTLRNSRGRGLQRQAGWQIEDYYYYEDTPRITLMIIVEYSFPTIRKRAIKKSFCQWPSWSLTHVPNKRQRHAVDS